MHQVFAKSGDDQKKPDIGEFLEVLCLTKYLPLFEKEEVDFETLVTMTEVRSQVHVHCGLISGIPIGMQRVAAKLYPMDNSDLFKRTVSEKRAIHSPLRSSLFVLFAGRRI